MRYGFSKRKKQKASQSLHCRNLPKPDRVPRRPHCERHCFNNQTSLHATQFLPWQRQSSSVWSLSATLLAIDHFVRKGCSHFESARRFYPTNRLSRIGPETSRAAHANPKTTSSRNDRQRFRTDIRIGMRERVVHPRDGVFEVGRKVWSAVRQARVGNRGRRWQVGRGGNFGHREQCQPCTPRDPFKLTVKKKRHRERCLYIDDAKQ